ncbi:MAG: SHOCT domain-containing protein [Gammaproteobacteria bacterium]
MINNPKMTKRQLTSKGQILVFALLFLGLLVPATGVQADLLPGIFKAKKINKNIWKLNEQYVALAPSSPDRDKPEAPNSHPVVLEIDEVRDALRSLDLWVDGGFFREEEAVRVLSDGQVTTMSRYVVEALAQAKPEEDVVFVVRGYGNVAFDVVREKYWTSGRIFYVEDKLNVIIGTYQERKDRGVRQAEGAHGILNDYQDLFFDHGNRNDVAKMPGRIVASDGVEPGGRKGGKARPDWVKIDIETAVAAYRNSLIPEEDRKRDKAVRAEAARLTIERRQMREEMARLRKELNDLKGGSSGASAPDLEKRLDTLKELKDKSLISEEEYIARRAEILQDI